MRVEFGSVEKKKEKTCGRWAEDAPRKIFELVGREIKILKRIKL
jgi:hypothetical protein